MKTYINLIAVTLLIFLVACDDSTTSSRDEVVVTRAYTTEVASGSVSGTWNMAGSPYFVSGDITVPAGQTLVIEAGVDVYMNNLTSLFVEGTLDVRGQLGSMVRFLGYELDEDYGLWQGIVFREGSDASSMRYAMVAFGSKFNNTDPEKTAAVTCTNSSPLIEHCLIWLNQYNGITLQGTATPQIRSNIIYENDGSGIVFDTTHVGNTTRIEGWLSDSLIVHNNVSANSSLPFRYSTDFAVAQFHQSWDTDTVDVDAYSLGVDVIGFDLNGDEVYRRNEANDKVDIFANSIEDAQFDQLEADAQAFNSCSPCIQTAFDYGTNGERTDVGPIVYNQAANELRKRIKNPDLGNAVYTVTCDAFSHDPVTLSSSTVEFAGYYGLNFDGGVVAENSHFGPTADRQIGAAWKSVVVNGENGGTAHFANCDFELGSESSYSGQDWINAGGMIELRAGATALVENCSFSSSNSHGVSASGAGSMLNVIDCDFSDSGLSAVYVSYGARGRISGCDIQGFGTYGIYFYNTDYFSQIENNLVAGGDQYGIKLHDAPGVEILQNTIAGNGYGGIKLDANCDPLIRYNLIADNDFSGSEIATGIVGTTLGETLDTNNPDVNVNWFSGNGGDDMAAMPTNWTVGECNDFTQVTLGAGYAFGGSIEDCEAGGSRAIGWGAGQIDNPGPMLGSIGNLVSNEDLPIALWLNALSFGGDNDFTFTATTDEENLEVVLDGRHLILNPAADWFGSATLTVSASNSEGMDEETVTVTFRSVNDAPVFAELPDATIVTGDTFTREIEISDVEGDGLSLVAELIVVSGGDEGHELVLEGNLVTVQTFDGFVGTLRVSLTVTDDPDDEDQALETRATFDIEVTE